MKILARRDRLIPFELEGILDSELLTKWDILYALNLESYIVSIHLPKCKYLFCSLWNLYSDYTIPVFSVAWLTSYIAFDRNEAKTLDIAGVTYAAMGVLKFDGAKKMNRTMTVLSSLIKWIPG